MEGATGAPSWPAEREPGCHPAVTVRGLKSIPYHLETIGNIEDLQPDGGTGRVFNVTQYGLYAVCFR